MKFIYKDPKKKGLQKLEVALMLLLLPTGLYFGAQSFQKWKNFEKAKVLQEQGSRFVHQGNLSEGILKLEESVKLYPESYGTWEDLAVAYHMTSDLNGEIDAYQRATKALPKNGNLRRELATAYHNAGDHKTELIEAQIAVNLGTTDEVFTSRILMRAQKEASGEVSTEKDHSSHEGHDQ